jgi:hypothetical protein
MTLQSCNIVCGGFQSVRPECAANACNANTLCYHLDPTLLDDGVSCADWCCVSHSATAFVLVLLLCMGLFFAAAGYYLRRLHQINVASGAVTADGKLAVDGAAAAPPSEARPAPNSQTVAY